MQKKLIKFHQKLLIQKTDLKPKFAEKTSSNSNNKYQLKTKLQNSTVGGNQFLQDWHLVIFPWKVTRQLQSMHITFVSGLLFSLPSFGFCKDFLKDCIHKFAKVIASKAPIAKPSKWVYHILLHLKWILVTVSLKRLFIVDRQLLTWIRLIVRIRHQ